MKGYDNSLNSWIDKKILLYKISYFPEPYTSSKNKIEVELDLASYAAKSDLKNKANVDISKFAKKADLVSLKSDIDKLDIDELEKVPNGLGSLKSKVDTLDADKVKPVRTDLNELSRVVDNENVKKDVYDELVEKVNAIGPSGLVNKQIMML